MALSIILAILALGVTAAYYFGYGLYQQWYWFWIWIVMPVASYWLLFGILIIILFIMSLFMTLNKNPKESGWARWVSGQVAKVCLILFRAKCHVSGLGKIPDKGKFMLINNHLSMLDEFALFYYLRFHKMTYITKPSNLDIPIAGQWMRRSGCKPIIQNDYQDGKRVIEECAELIKSGKSSVCVAPEGTRNKSFPDPIMLPFHPGTFNLALQAKCPIVIVALQNTNAVAQRFPLQRTHIYVDVVAVIEPEDYEGMTSNELAERCRKLLLGRLEAKEARFYHLKPKKVDDANETK